MKMIDLTHRITEDMLLFPGTDAPCLERITLIGTRETNLCLNNHLGTHMDSPAHTEEKGAFLDELPVSRFFGLAVMVDVSQFRGGSIPADFLKSLDDELKFCQFLVLNSGYHRLWGEDAYFSGFPILSPEAAEYLASLPELSGVALDMISVDPVESQELPIHRILLGAGKLIVENLAHLDQVEGEHFLLSAMPLRFDRADGSPIRAVAYQAPAGIYYPR